MVALGRVNTMVAPRPPNMSAFALNVLLPQWPVGQALTSGLNPGDLDAVLGLLDDTDGALARARPRAEDGAWVLDEARAMAALLRLSATDAQLRLAGDGSLRSVSQADRRKLAHQLDDVVGEHRRLWALRFRPGGMSDSVAWFDNLRSSYLSGAPDPAWFGPFG